METEKHSTIQLPFEGTNSAGLHFTAPFSKNSQVDSFGYIH